MSNCEIELLLQQNGIVEVDLQRGGKGDTGERGEHGFGGALGKYGSFFDSSDQHALNTVDHYAVVIGTTAETNGVTIVDGSKITFEEGGTYSITYSIQFNNTEKNVVHDVDTWLVLNGTYLESTNSVTSVPASRGGNPGKIITTVDYLLTLEAGDYLQLFWHTGSTNVSINTIPDGSIPDSPSIIVTVKQVMYTQMGNGIENIVVTPDEGGNTITVNFTDGVTEPVSFSVANGTDGVSITSITKVDTVGLVDKYEIVYSTGSRSYFYVTNGADGYTPIKGVDYFDGYTPAKGVDYFDGEDNVYVGATEPTDPETKVWIDTDADPQTVINDGVTSLDRTWSSTKITTAMQGKTITDAGGYFGTDTVEGALAELGAKGTVLSDVTINANWKPGTWTADSTTDTLTCSINHGYIVGNTVSFDAGTGVLPGGISSGDEYYFVESVPTPTTLKIKLTRAGEAVDITSDGTTGWKIRNATVNYNASDVIPLNFSQYGEVDIYSFFDMPQRTVDGNSYLAIILAPSSTKLLLNDANVYGATEAAFLYSSVASKKYVRMTGKVNIKKIAPQLYAIQIDISGLSSGNADLSSATAYTRVFNGRVTGGDITSLKIIEGYSSSVRNGSRFVIIRR